MKITIENPEVGAIKISRQQAIELGINPDLDQQHGELKTFGPWQIPVSYKALCLSSVYDNIKGYTDRKEVTFYGLRTMAKPVHSAGSTMEGRVSIDGKKYSAFTSSQLFEIDGKLIDVATIHARI